MSNTALLQAAWQAAAGTRPVLIGTGALASVPDIFEQVSGNRSAVIVADENAFDVAGCEVQRQFSAANLHSLNPFIFTGQPLHADDEPVLEVESALRQHLAIPVVVGSGTLNDLTKLAAHRCERP